LLFAFTFLLYIMEFGRVDSSIINKINFKLPVDAAETARILEKSNVKNIKPNVLVGCAKWGRKDWIGKIYPPKTKEADFLRYYARHFSCIELNTTYYRAPTRKQAEAWRSKVGDNFKFCPKFTEEITHSRRLSDVRDLTDEFLEGISGFENNLGPVFFLPHPSMGPEKFETIHAFIESLPKDLDVFIELRQKDWFSDRISFRNMFGMLENTNTGAIITDASGRRDCVHMRLTTPEAFIRFVGNGLHPTDYIRIDDWVQRIKSWLESGIQKVYFFMHQHNELHSPELAKYLIQQLNMHCGLSIPGPVFIQKTNLFD